MNVIAYTYEADYHCADCTRERFGDSKGDLAITNGQSWCDALWPTLDSDGNLVHPVFSTDEWQEFDESYLAENPTQYLACGDCHDIIETYSVEVSRT